jgi:hypothetical protein
MSEIGSKAAQALPHILIEAVKPSRKGFNPKAQLLEGKTMKKILQGKRLRGKAQPHTPMS